MRTELVPDYLTFLWVPGADTLFEGIFKLEPGHCATVARGQLKIRQWWDMSFAPEEREPERVGGDGARSGRFRGHPPNGLGRSAGQLPQRRSGLERDRRLDDRRRWTGHDLHGRVHPEDLSHDIVPDDVRYARQVGRTFGTDYHEEILKPSIVDLLPKLIWHMDEPIADPACISTYLICRAARERLTVILSGMGGDELFAGYPRHLAARLGHAVDIVPRSARTALAETIGQRLTLGPPGRWRGPRRNLMKLLRGIDAPPIERYLTYSSYYKTAEMQQLLRTLDGPADRPFATHRRYAQAAKGEDWLNQILYLDLKTFLPSLNLAYTDKMSMAASTEVRVPLLDDELVELSGRIPPSLKLHRLTRKYVLKRAMEPVLPREVIWRPKAGFGAPVRSWLVGELEPDGR